MTEQIIDDSDQPIASYASDTTRSGYVTAMRRLAATRPADTPARVYISALPAIRRLPHWPAIRKGIARQIPGAELITFEDAFPGGTPQYDTEWEQFAAGLDGLVLVAQWAKKRSKGRMCRIGPYARAELKTLVAARKPVLLNTHRGLIPLIDCKPRANETNGGLHLRIPPAWTTGADTLTAALTALNSEPPSGAVQIPQPRIPQTAFAAPPIGG